MSRPDRTPILTRQDLVLDDIAALRQLEDLGLLDADAEQRPGRMVFRLIGRVPAGFLDSHGEPRRKDRWAFKILVEATYPRRAPSIHLEADSFVPDNEFFPVSRPLIGLRAPQPRWKPPVEFRHLITRPADCALAFLWTLNPRAVARFLAENASAFSDEPLGSHDLLPYLLEKAEAMQGGSTAPAAARSPRKKQFVIREQQEHPGAVPAARPKAYQMATRVPGTSKVVYVRRAALGEIFDHIEWGHRTPRNVHEQGGVLVGMRYHEPGSTEEFVTITSALPAQSDERSSVYVKFDHAAWSALLHELDVRKEKGLIDEHAVIVGWYHTHPNELDCFMSGTDRVTQQSIFHRPWNYALVINPHRRILACFVGAESEPCAAGILD